jgi:hypothetical protein
MFLKKTLWRFRESGNPENYIDKPEAYARPSSRAE